METGIPNNFLQWDLVNVTDDFHGIINLMDLNRLESIRNNLFGIMNDETDMILENDEGIYME